MMTDVLLAVLAIEVPVVGFMLWREMLNTAASRSVWKIQTAFSGSRDRRD